jgi:hypothetical protein
LCRFDGPAPDVAFLRAYDISGEILAFAAQNAARGGTSPRDELFALGFPRDRYWQLLAEALGLAFIGDLADATHVSNSGILTTDAVRHAGYALARIDGRVVQVLAPDVEELAALRHRLDVMPTLAERTRIASPETIRGFIVAHRHSVLIHYAVNRLARVMPRLSSSRRAKGARGPMALLASVLAIGLVAPLAALAGIGLLATLFFLNCSMWKLATAFRRWRPLRLEPLSSDRLPAYSVLVPLYREAGIVGDLVANLRKLDYPALCIKRTTGAVAT